MSSLFQRAPRRLASPTARRIPLYVYRRLYPRFPLGFFYHVISDEPAPHIQHLYPYKSSTEFEEDLVWLKSQTTLIGYQELVSHFQHHTTLPASSAYISFDDGFRECYDVVRPLLLKHNVPCVFFLTTDWIDNKQLFFRSKVSLIIDHLIQLPPLDRATAIRSAAASFGCPGREEDFLTWLKGLKTPLEHDIDALCQHFGIDIPRFLHDKEPYLSRSQIREMQSEGFVFGAHTLNHIKLMHLQEDEQVHQIVESCRIVMEITGKDQVPFAFPFSGDKLSPEMLENLRQEHPEIGLIFDTKKLRREPGILHRIWADRPVPGVSPKKNLAYWLHDAYRILWLEMNSK